MTIDDETRGRIRRLYYADHFTINGIAEVLSIHHDTVKRAIRYDSFKPRKRITRASLLDPFKPVIDEKLSLYPKITATRLIQILEDKGYKGSLSLLRLYLRGIRGHYKKVYMRMRVDPGEQGQVDWAHCGTLRVDGENRKLYAFVVVLSYSRAVFARFCLNQKTATFLRCHEQAFEYFAGIPRIILYDNLKSVVLSRHGREVRFNPEILEFSGFYCYEPRPCGPYRGNEKGRVERVIRYIRSNFLAARELTDIKTANESLLKWCDQIANRRPWPEDRRYSVRAMWEKERPKLLRLTERRLHPRDQAPTTARKCPWVHYDLNTYSIPAAHVGKVLMIQADDDTVEIVSDGEAIVRHARSYGRGVFVEDKAHRSELVEHAHFGRTNQFRDNIIKDFPATEKIIAALFELGHETATVVRNLYRLRYKYGGRLFEQAVSKAVSEKRYTIESLRYILQQIEKDAGTPPMVEVDLPDKPEVRDLEIRSKSLSTYDEL